MEQFTSTERPQSENGQMIDLPGKLALLKTERARTKQERRVLDDNIRKLDGNIELLEKAMQITLLLPEWADQLGWKRKREYFLLSSQPHLHIVLGITGR